MPSHPAIAEVLRRLSRAEGAVIPGLFLVAVLLGCLSLRQTAIWEDSAGLHRHMIKRLGDHGHLHKLFQVLGQIVDQQFHCNLNSTRTVWCHAVRDAARLEPWTN